MTDWPKVTGGKLRKRAPASAADIAQLEASLNVNLPADYKAFLLWSNGGDGDFGDLYLAIWSIDEAVRLNDLYAIRRRLGDRFIGVGTDGGGLCFAMDLRRDAAFAVVPLGALADDEIKHLAGSLVEGLTDIRDGKVTGNNL